MKLNRNGKFYKYISKICEYSNETKECIENTLYKLMTHNTTAANPGLLYGEAQSGKTKTYIGICSLALDNKFETVIILTKSSMALVSQTLSRLKDEFDHFYKEDSIQLFNIMHIPEDLTNYELEQKTFILVKKEKNNLIRLDRFLFQKYPHLSTKKILIIDDEADFASVGFEKKNNINNLRVIPQKINEIRQKLKNSSYLQVTATPFALFLQPNSIEINGQLINSLKPSFIELVPKGENYIGGEYYFEKSNSKNSIANYLYEEVQDNELDTLKKYDNTQFNDKENVKKLKSALINFIVGSVIRRLQQIKKKTQLKKYSFIIHTETKKMAHKFQNNIITQIINNLYNIANETNETFNILLKESYLNLKKSLLLTESYIPTFNKVKKEVIKIITNNYILVTTVNSEKHIGELLEEGTGELKLRAPLNIFIGGQVLDRGVTIKNLIGFYYGRNPNKFQQDTVIQHCRMYGYRDVEDLAVTRFYTTRRIYKTMKKIYELEKKVRESIKMGNENYGVIFIQKDNSNKIEPCSTNKLSLPKISILKPYKRLLPVGFQTKTKKEIEKFVTNIDDFVAKTVDGNDSVLIDIQDAIKIIEDIGKTFDNEKGEPWDIKTFITCMEYLTCYLPKNNIGKIWLIIRKNRNNVRYRQNFRRYEDSPDTGSGENNELNYAKKIAIENPALILIRQQGLRRKGWKNAEFWWPVLVAQSITPTVVFTNSIQDN